MKQIMYILSSLVTAALLSAGCSSYQDPVRDIHLLTDFTLSIGYDSYHAEIDYESGTARIGAIEYTGQISGVGYKIAEGATIEPDPETLVTRWPEKQEFTVTKDGRSETYTVYLSAYQGRWPEESGEIVFFEDFEGDELDGEVWDYITKGEASWQKYMSGSPEQAYIEDGKLILVIERKNGAVVSGGIKTEHKKWFGADCRIEVSARFVDDHEEIGQAIWLMPQTEYQTYPGWPDGGEIDIMEHNWGNDYVQQTLHSHYIDVYSGHSSGARSYAGFNQGQFNVYRVDMTSEEITFYTNDVPANGETGYSYPYRNLHLENEEELMQWPFDGQFYLILSVGPAGQNEIEYDALYSKMEVDWVRITRLGGNE